MPVSGSFALDCHMILAYDIIFVKLSRLPVWKVKNEVNSSCCMRLTGANLCGPQVATTAYGRGANAGPFHHAGIYVRIDVSAARICGVDCRFATKTQEYASGTHSHHGYADRHNASGELFGVAKC